jgi:hypothetical protein
MKKQNLLILYAFLSFMALTSPFWIWQLQPSNNLNIFIMDKTSLSHNNQERHGLEWILKNGKFLNRNSESLATPKSLKQSDILYLTTKYDVTNKAEQLEKALFSERGKTFIAEFNTFAEADSKEENAELLNLLNLDWSGWIGRYYPALDSGEVPQWIKTNYEALNQEWKFKGSGLVFVSKNDYVVVVEEKDLTEDGIIFNLTKKGKKKFNRMIQGKYQSWFDIVNARGEEEVLANYKLPVTPKAERELSAYGIPISFPAIIHQQNSQYSSYYFSGDYSGESEVPGIFQTKGLDLWKKHFGEKDSFYWNVYVPLMKELLENGLFSDKDKEEVELVVENRIKTNSKTDDSYIQIQQDGKWKDILVKGVNMGIGKPGYFPGETAITKAEYFRWFKQIGEMNANALRIYTLHPPQFYEAFYQYNQLAEKPLFLFHGTWVNEENLLATQDAYEKINVDDARLEIKNMLDIIHGNAVIPDRPGHASGVYKYDISKYVLGIIIGTEWDPIMVSNTNKKHSDIGQFQGNFFHTVQASPFEAWLAGLLDYAAEYETKQYKWQHTLSFTNWVTTDLLRHPAEPSNHEDLVTINPNHIKTTEEFKAGLFASYHVYPYYPDFLNFEEKYTEYVDSFGNKNNYAGYLDDLLQEHNLPVLVAEFGVPSSRGMTHVNVGGMNQGFHSESEQGQIDTRLFQSIVSEGYAGGLVFTWQDEWFKRTWNTMDLDNPDRRPYWNNQQTNEQHFGLLGFEPGKKESAIIVDGESMDWEVARVESFYQSREPNAPLKEIRLASDNGYLYFLLNYNQPVDFEKEGTYLLFDTIVNQGQSNIMLNNKTTLKTDYGVDFLLKLTGPEDSRIMVDSYYDTFYYQYGHLLKMIKQEAYIKNKNNGVFHPIRLALNKELTIPSTGQTIPFQDYETGVLTFGTANPKEKEFNSLTDISVSEDKRVIEGRITWQLLNIKDPSLKEVMGDLWKSGLSGSETIEGIRVAAAISSQVQIIQTFPNSQNRQLEQGDVRLFKWKEWDQPNYYERLKNSYMIMKETYGMIDIGNND